MSAMLRQQYIPQYSNTTGSLGGSLLENDPVSEMLEIDHDDSIPNLVLGFDDDDEKDMRSIFDYMSCLHNVPSPLSPEEIRNLLSMPLPIDDDPQGFHVVRHSSNNNKKTPVDKEQDFSSPNNVSDDEEATSSSEDDSTMEEDVPKKRRKQTKPKKLKTQEEIEALARKTKKIRRGKMVKGGLPCILTEIDAMQERGSKNNLHLGNKKLLKMVQARCKSYLLSGMKGKPIIAQEIMEEFKADGGRFLIREDKHSDWFAVQEEHVIDKIMHMLRDQAKPKDKASQSSAAKKSSKKNVTTRSSNPALTYKKRQQKKYNLPLIFV